MGLAGLSSYAQTITTTLLNNNGNSVVVFSIQNNSPTAPYLLTDIGSVANFNGTGTARLYAKPATYNVAPGVPGAITAVNGWTDIGSNTALATTANTTGSGSTATNWISGMSYSIAPLSQVRFCLQHVSAGGAASFSTAAGAIRYSTVGVQACSFPSGDLAVNACTGYAFGGLMTGPAFTPRGFIGFVTLVASTPCAGTPAPGNTVSSAASVCSGANFTLSLQNPTNGLGVSYQWQSDTGGGFVNFGTSAPTQVTSQTVATSYQCIVTCSTGPSSGTSNAISVPMLSSTCECASYPFFSATDPADEEITSVTVGSMTNASTCATVAPGVGSIARRYSNYAGIVTGPTATQNSSVSFSLTQFSCGGAYDNGFQIYVDYNQNGSFADAGEQVYNQPTPATGNHTVTGSFTVPNTAFLGTTRMRVVNVEVAFPTATNYATSAYTWGETEDYCFTVSASTACTGTPAPGNTLSTIATACPSTNFTLSLQNLVLGSGITYDWQSSLDGISYTSTGGTLSTYTTSQVVVKWYRCVVTCSTGPNSGTSTPINVTMNPSACACGVYSIFAASSTADEDITNVTIGTMTNASTCATVAPGAGSIQNLYSNYTGSVVGATAAQLDNVSFSLTQLSCGGAYSNGFQIHGDWNQDGDFADAGEQVYSQPTPVTGNHTLTGTFQVPISALVGTTRIRVVNVEVGFPTATNYAITTYQWGETEDYCFTVTPTTACSSTPTPGNTLSTLATACAGINFTLSLQNFTPGTGITYQWQTSPDNIAPYTNIGGATSSTYTQAMAGTAYYRCAVTCSNGPLVGNSNPLQVTQSPGTSCYCVPVTTAGCTDGDVIAQVILNTLNNNSGTGCPSGLAGYSNYTATAASPPNTYTTTLQAGTSYGCTVFAGQYPEGYAAWIDYNDDGVFAGTERIGYSIGQVAGSGLVGVLGSSATFPIVLLCNPPLGVHRLRVRCMYAVDGINVTPCTANTWGETEDYLVTISAAVPCPQPINLAVSNVTTSTAVLGWTLGCAETVWDLQVQTVGGGVPAGPGTNPGLTSPTFTATGLITGTTYEFYVRANCGGLAGQSAWAGPFTFAPPPLNDVCTGVVIQTVGAGGSITFNGNSTGALDTETFGANVAWEAFTLTDCVPSLEVSWCGSNPARTIAFINLFTACPFGAGSTIAATSVLNDCANGGRRHLYANLLPGTYYIPISEQAGGSGPYSITVNPGAACPAPSCVTTPNPADASILCAPTGVTLNWPAVTYASSYEVFLDGVSVSVQPGLSYNAGVLTGAHTWKVVPSGSTGVAVGCPTWSFTIGAAIDCYCSSAATTTADEEIYSVTFNGVTNGLGAAGCTVPATGTGSLLSRYANYRNLGSLWNFTQGIPAPFTVVEDECDGPTYYPFGTAIWIDLNQDGVFDDNTEKIFVEGTTATGPRNVLGSITVPFGSTPGLTGMRITVAEGISGAGLTACLSYGFGETEDYLVTILAANNNFTCATAQPVSCFAIENSYITGANSLPAGACAFNNAGGLGGTNWFVYTSPLNQDVTFSVCSPGIDVQINAFKATAAPDCSNLVCVGGADNSPGCAPGADLKIKADLGEVIYIAVSGVTAVSGSYVFQVLCDVQCSPGVSNDMCADATDMNPLPYLGFGSPIAGDNTCAYVDGPTGNSGADPVQGLWYSFNSGVNSTLRMTLTPGTASSLKWALHSGACTGLDAATEVATGNSGVTILNVIPGTNYRLLVFNSGGTGVQGTYTLRVQKPGINDASISQVSNPFGTICDTQFQPVVKLKNLGEAPLTTVQITVKVDATTVNTINWTGPVLASGDSVTLTLPLVLSTGSHVLNVNTDLPNGLADDIPSNDLASSAYQANGQTVKVRVTTDNNPGQTTWTIFAPGAVPVASGGPYILPNTTTTTTVCLPVTGGNTKWFFFLFDSFGDGICCSSGLGSWQLLNRVDRMILRDNGQFSTQSPNTPPLTSSYAVGHEVNLPLGPSRPWTAAPYNVCGVLNLGMQAKIRCTTVIGVTNYQWEFSNPDAGYQRRVSAPTNFVTYVSMQVQQPQLGVTYFVRNRADQGAAGFADDLFGEGCEIAWNNANSQFCTGLVSTAGATFSCGATRTWGGSSKVWATPVVGAYPYDANGNGSFADAGDQQFAYHFRFVGAGGYIRDIYRTNYICPLAWTTNPLLAGSTYQVTVETQAGGVWRGFCGTTCNLTIAAGPGQGGNRIDAPAITAENIELWPNPVRDGIVNLRVDGIADAEQRIAVDIYDAFGKKVVAQQYANSGSLFNTTLNLDGGLAAGVYMVNITINDRTSLKRLTVL